MKRASAFRPRLLKLGSSNQTRLPLPQNLHILSKRYSTLQDSHLWEKSDPPVFLREGKPNGDRVKGEHRHGYLPPDKTTHTPKLGRSEKSLYPRPNASDASARFAYSQALRKELGVTLKNMTGARKRRLEKAGGGEGRSKLQKRSHVVDEPTKHLKGTSQESPAQGSFHETQSGKQDMEGTRQEPQAQRHNASVLPTIKVLTEHDLPEMPKELFRTPKTTLHNTLQSSRGKLSSRFSGSSRGTQSCTLTCSIPSVKTMIVIGQHSTKKLAEVAAYRQLLAYLHQEGLLEGLFPPKVKHLDKATFKAEKDAKTDVYNYAALYGFVPKFSARFVPRLIASRRNFVEATIELPEQNILVKGRGESLRIAEISAALRFKEEAEKYQAQQGTASIVIRDSAALNTTTVKSFFDYYKMITPGAKIEVQSGEEIEYKAFGAVPKVAQIFINGNSIGEKVIMSNKKEAEDLAYLTAAMVLRTENPKLFVNFSQAQRSSKGDILLPVNPVTLKVDEDNVNLMRQTLLEVRKAGLADEKEELEMDEEASEVRRARFREELLPELAASRVTRIVKAYENYCHSPALAELRRKREDLPMNQYRKDVINIVRDHVYSIIIGATGSGKTTQVPQILFEEAIKNDEIAECNIICTQPRRIAATSVARRVADERAEQLQDTVGYHVRFDAKVPKLGGSITYCTTGILLQQLQHSPDEVLDSTSHIIIDEVHERDMLIDFLLIIIKKVIAERIRLGKKTPKVTLMSATMDSDLFASYFKNGNKATEMSDCPTLSVPGRTFPVKEVYLESLMDILHEKYTESQLQLMQSEPSTRDYYEVEKRFHKASTPSSSSLPGNSAQGEESIINWKEERKISSEGIPIVNDLEDALIPLGLIATTVAHIANTTQEGAILVFLPGLDEILKVNKLLTTACILGVDFTDPSRFKVHMLHSSIPAGQTDVFNPVPSGCRKIILSTNIAETSVTIPDVQFVVDTGKLREKQYDQVRRITALKCTWISKSNSKQRAGRAGRVQNGNYYALFTKARFESMRAIGLPELLRSDLQETCLNIKAQKLQTPIRQFLAEAIEPPPAPAVDASVSSLIALDALNEDENMTPLGRVLASLPVHPTLGKMIVLGVIFRCLDPMLLLGAGAQERSIFLSPLERRKEANKEHASFVRGSNSDHFAFLNAIRELRSIRRLRGQYAMSEFAREKFIHHGTFKVIEATARQVEEILEQSGIIPRTPGHLRENQLLGHPSLNENSNNEAIIKALILAGLHPNLAVGVSSRTFRTPGERGTICHPTSTNAVTGKDESNSKSGALLSYTTMARSNDGNTIYLRDTTVTSPLMACLFGGRLSHSSDNYRVLLMDKWLPFYVRSEDGRALKTIVEFRKALERLLTSAFRDLSSKKFLTQNSIREEFAKGLVEVLNRDSSSERVLHRAERWEQRKQGDRGLVRKIDRNSGWMPATWLEGSKRD